MLRRWREEGEVIHPFMLFFLLSVPPKFTEIPEQEVRVKGNSVASAVCRAFGFPAPRIQWSRAFASLPQGRVTVINGTLKIISFSAKDVGTYQCKATNKLGSVSTLTTFSFAPGKRFNKCRKGTVLN